MQTSSGAGPTAARSKALQRIIRNTSLQTLETPELCDQRGRRCFSLRERLTDKPEEDDLRNQHLR